MKHNLPQLLRARTKRRKFTFGTPDPLARDRDALLRIYLRVIRHWEEARGRILAAYGRELDNVLTRDSVDDLQDAIDSEASWFSRIFLSLEVAIAEWTAALEAWHRSKWRGSILSASGVDVDTMLYAGDVEQTLESVIRQNVALIKDVDAQQAQKMTGIVFRGLNERLPARDVAKQLAEVTGFGRKRALLIASDQLQKAATALDSERMYEAGITQFVWRHSGKKHPREWHKARNGKRYDLRTRKEVGGDEVIPADDMPGIPIRCFPSWEPVKFVDDVHVLWRRWHSGHLTQIVTDEGRVLSATPNHPILTDSGWKAAEAINVGDNLVDVCLSGFDALDVEIKKRQPRIGDLFAAAQVVFGSVSLDGHFGDFHGDGSAYQNVDAVNVEGGLRNKIKASGSEVAAKLLLENPDMAFGPLTKGGILTPLLGIDSNTTRGIVRGLDLLESLCWRQISPGDETGLACVADIYSAILKALGDGGTGNADTAGNRLDALTGFVGSKRSVGVKLLPIVCLAKDILASAEPAPSQEILGEGVARAPNASSDILDGFPLLESRYSKVKEVVTRAWSGHVFNLQTDSGWYIVGNTGVRNCGCKKQAYFEIEGVDDDGNPV